MPEPPPRKRFQIHLSTAIVLMFVAGALIWANVQPRTLNNAGLYTDAEVSMIKERFANELEGDPFGGGLLNIVPIGSTMKIKLIFEKLGFAPEALAQPKIESWNMVDSYIWQISPSHSLSIMTANNDFRNNFKDTLSLHGYGVRIQKSSEPVIFEMGYGWPVTAVNDRIVFGDITMWQAGSAGIVNNEEIRHFDGEHFRRYHYLALLLDILTALLLLIITWRLLEWLIHRRASRKKA